MIIKKYVFKSAKKAEEAKSCMKVQNGKTIEYQRQNEFKSHTNSENHPCHDFVKFNKKKTFEKTGGILLENVKEFGNKGLSFFVFYFNVLFCIYYYTYDLV